MPIWLASAIVGLSFWTAFFCPKCQKWNQPQPFNVQQTNVADIITAIRDTPVIVPREELNVMLLQDAHTYYDSIYTHVEQCSHLPVDSTLYRSIDFYVADHATFMTEQGEALAYYDENTRSVILGLVAVWDKKIIGHEILHAILADHGIDSWDHPALWFDILCKDVVVSPNRMQ